MKLNREEIEFVSEAMLKYDVVTGITANDIEVRVHGAYLNSKGEQSAVGSSATYRTKDTKAMFNYHLNQTVKAENELRDYRARKELSNSGINI